MMHFTVESFSPADAACQKCCCETISLKPGTTTKVSVGYAPWALPIGQLHCAPQFSIEKMDTCLVPTPSNMAPQITALDGMARFDTGTNVPLNGDMRTKVTDFENDPLTFKVLPLYGPRQGKIVLDPSGTFTYTPLAGFKGEERFYASAADPTNPPLIFEVMIAVGIDAGTMVPSPVLSVGMPIVNQKYFTVSFPITLSPAAQECDVWRLTVLQGALDCQCICYTRTDCFDVKVAKC